MRSVRSWATLGSVGLVVGAVMLAGGVSAAGAATPRTALKGSMTPAVARSQSEGAVASTSTVSFQLLLKLRNASKAQSVVRSISNPASARYRHYLTDAQWEAKFSPTKSQVKAAKAWLRSQGFSVGAVAKDRLLVAATGTAAQVEKAFSTTLGNYDVGGKTLRQASSQLSIPSSIAGFVAGVVGVNQAIEQTSLTNGLSAPSGAAASPGQEPPPPAGFRNPEPCSSYWGQKMDTIDNPSLYAPFESPQAYDICGYKPSQLRDGYGISTSHSQNGSGVTIAIVDAYDSPTLLSDVQTYFQMNDPNHPLASSQFTNVEPAKVDQQGLCDGSGWYPEQALDIESSHSMAPGANIEFVGAEDCFDTSLLSALTTAITSGASVVSDSWGDDVGDLLDDAASKTAYDDTFMLADATGVSVLFSSGDDGDNFADFGLTAPDYPASSPYITAVGGTTLEVGNAGARLAEYGWSTAKQPLCVGVPTTNCDSATTPAGPLAWQAGGGGGTSYYYTQPYYQAGVVPSSLALRNEAIFGPVPLRVEPDISMDADAQSGFLIGLTQTFPDGTYYDQFKEGGTSLASPTLAGVIADADEAAGTSLGFLNPTLYKAYKADPGTFNDILPPTDPDAASVVRVDYANTVDTSDGYNVSLRAINYAGKEVYCDATNNCESRKVTLTTKKGFDSLTGLGSVGPNFISTMKNF
jgi:subtilase family serine protease